MKLDLNSSEFEPLKLAKIELIQNKNPQYIEIVEIVQQYSTDVPKEVVIDKIHFLGAKNNDKELREWIKSDKVLLLGFDLNNKLQILETSKKYNGENYNIIPPITVNENAFTILYK